MALREGQIRKDGQPARKPGYGTGRNLPNVGRKRRTTCAYPSCEEPPIFRARGDYGDGKKDKLTQYCSQEHQEQHYREQYYIAQYGITVQDYERLLLEQGGVCAICGSADAKTGRRGRPGRWSTTFHVDHDHETGQVRGLLCSLCNRMLGQACDSSQRLELGAAYLRKHGR